MSWHEPTLGDLAAEIEDVAANATRTLEPNALAQVLAFLTKIAHILKQAPTGTRAGLRDPSPPFPKSAFPTFG